MKKFLISFGALLCVASNVQAQKKSLSVSFSLVDNESNRTYTAISDLEGARYLLEVYDTDKNLLKKSETNSITFDLRNVKKVIVSVKAANATDSHEVTIRDSTSQTVTQRKSVKSNPVILLPAGVNSFSKNTFAISPNPATDKLQIILGNTVGNTTATFSNIAGQVVMQEVITGPNATLSVNQLPAGMYLLQLQNGTQIYTEKVQIQH